MFCKVAYKYILEAALFLTVQVSESYFKNSPLPSIIIYRSSCSEVAHNDINNKYIQSQDGEQRANATIAKKLKKQWTI